MYLDAPPVAGVPRLSLQLAGEASVRQQRGIGVSAWRRPD